MSNPTDHITKIVPDPVLGRHRQSGQLSSDDDMEVSPQRAGFLSAFAHRPSLPRHSCARQRIPLSSRSAYREHRHDAPDSVGVSVFRTREIRPGWVPSLPRGGGVLPTSTASPVGACRFSTASPIPRWNIPSAELLITRHTKIHFRSPVRSSPRPSPLDETGTLRLSPQASHPTVTHDARQGGDGPTDTGPNHAVIK